MIHTLMTPMEPKKVSISASVTFSGRPETKTLSSITIRSSAGGGPPSYQNYYPISILLKKGTKWDEISEVNPQLGFDTIKIITVLQSDRSPNFP